jgi:hypothetical protein
MTDCAISDISRLIMFYLNVLIIINAYVLSIRNAKTVHSVRV